MTFEEKVHTIKQELAPALNKINEGAQFSWDAIVRQVQVEAFGYGIMALIFVTILVVAILLAVHYFRKSNRERDIFYARGYESRVGTALLIALISGIISLPFIYMTVARLAKPEWYAIQKTLHLIGM